MTRSLNFYGNALGAQLVDLPGYGFAYADEEEVARWQEQMRRYLSQRGSPLRVVLCIDARQSIKQSDRDFLLWLDREASVPVHVVMTKCDLVLAEEHDSIVAHPMFGVRAPIVHNSVRRLTA